MILDRKRGRAGLLICLLLAVIAAVGLPGSASGAAKVQALNSSGNQNIRLSVDPIGKSEGFSAVLYNNKSGLLTSEANAIAQTGEGFIWIGSYAGLIRYDGSSFERMDSIKGISNVRCLYVDSGNRLWIGSNDSGLYLMSEGEVRHWDKSSGMETASVRCVAQAEDGTVYFGGTMGAVTVDAGLRLTPVGDARFSGKIVSDLRRGGDGLIYGITNAGDVFTLKEGRVTAWYDTEYFSIDMPLAILPDPEHPGLLYVGTEYFVCRGRLGQDAEEWDIRNVNPLRSMERLEYIDGRIWVCARTGIGVLANDGIEVLRNIPMNNAFGHVMTDTEGNLWITSTRQGVMKIVPNQFTELFEKYGLPAEVVNATCATDDGRLYIGADDGLIVVENRKKLSNLPVSKAVTTYGTFTGAFNLLELLQNVRIRSIVRDSEGRLWFSTVKNRGLVRYDGKEIIEFMKDDGLLSDAVRTVYECRDGRMIVATNEGVNVIEGNRVTAGYGPEEGLEFPMVLTIAEGDDGEILAGTDGGGIYVIRPDGIRRIGTEDGLRSEIVLRIRRSRFRNVFWIVTGNTLACMTPDYHIRTIREFPYTNNYDLYENCRGDLWVLGSSGIYVFPSGDLDSEEPDEPSFFGYVNGLPYIATANSFSCLTENGDLFIAGNEGVVKVNIDEPNTDVGSIRAAVPYVDADGTRYYPDESGGFTLPGNVRKVTVYPYVFNYSLTDPQISYRLAGFDVKETTVSRSRLTPVSYTNLQIGAFRFIMTVKDPARRSEQTVSFRIVKGKEMSVGTAGTIVMIWASLLMTGGTLAYTSPFRKRRRPEDRALFGLFLANMALAAGELLSYILEYITAPLVRELMITGNTVYYISYVLFPYMLLVYLDYRISPGKPHALRRNLLYGIPCFLFAAVILANLKTGWVFSITDGNVFRSGLTNRTAFLPSLPVWFYLILSLIRVSRISRRLALSTVLLLAARLAAGLCVPDISCTPFIYTLILVGVCFRAMNQQTIEVAS